MKRNPLKGNLKYMTTKSCNGNIFQTETFITNKEYRVSAMRWDVDVQVYPLMNHFICSVHKDQKRSKINNDLGAEKMIKEGLDAGPRTTRATPNPTVGSHSSPDTCVH